MDHTSPLPIDRRVRLDILDQNLAITSPHKGAGFGVSVSRGDVMKLAGD